MIQKIYILITELGEPVETLQVEAEIFEYDGLKFGVRESLDNNRIYCITELK